MITRYASSCRVSQLRFIMSCRARTVITAWVRSTSHAIQTPICHSNIFGPLPQTFDLCNMCVFTTCWCLCKFSCNKATNTENSTDTKVLLSTELERFQAWLELSWICCSQQAKLAFFGTWIFLWTWTSANWAKRWDVLLEFFEVVLLCQEGNLQFEWDMKDWTSFFTAVC